MSNKLTIELEMPADLTDTEGASSFLSTQLEYAVQALRDNLTYFKDKGLTVPTISVRNTGKTKKKVDNEFSTFRTTLLDLVLKYQPRVDVAQQIKTIKDLYALGKPTEEWIALFEASRATYALTTWHTVKYKLSNEGEKDPEQPFVRKEMDDTEINTLRERMRNYSMSED